MRYTYDIVKSKCPDGETSTVSFDIIDGKLHDVKFDQGGCIGNFRGFYRLVEGRDAREVAQTLTGIRCHYFGDNEYTSCAEQMGKAIKAALSQRNL